MWQGSAHSHGTVDDMQCQGPETGSFFSNSDYFGDRFRGGNLTGVGPVLGIALVSGELDRFRGGL